MRNRLLLRAFAVASAACLLGAWAPETAAAQTVDPVIAEFIPSSDHAATSSGTALVIRYDLSYYQMGAAQPFQVNSLGKPTPSSDGRIRFNISGLPRPTGGIVYQARVTAVGPGGTGASLPSNTFIFSGVVAPTAPTGIRIIR